MIVRLRGWLHRLTAPIVGASVTDTRLELVEGKCQVLAQKVESLDGALQVFVAAALRAGVQEDVVERIARANANGKENIRGLF